MGLRILRGDRSAPSNRRTLRRNLGRPEAPEKGDTGWLGRLDSNQGMAESKSDYFSLFLNRYSEKRWKFGPSDINSLGESSEWDHRAFLGAGTASLLGMPSTSVATSRDAAACACEDAMIDFHSSRSFRLKLWKSFTCNHLDRLRTRELTDRAN
jgi:hypothetical protein